MSKAEATLGLDQEINACASTEELVEYRTELREAVEQVGWYGSDERVVCYPTGRFKRRVYFARVGERLRIIPHDRRAPIRDNLVIEDTSGETPIVYTDRREKETQPMNDRLVSLSELREMAEWLERNVKATKGTVIATLARPPQATGFLSKRGFEG